jgi:BolA protein
MTMAARITEKLETRLAPTRLAVHDESHLHEGHAGWRPEGESHFRIEIVSEAFAGLGRLARHRLVHDVLAEELRSLHALQVRARTPEEAAGA